MLLAVQSQSQSLTSMKEQPSRIYQDQTKFTYVSSFFLICFALCALLLELDKSISFYHSLTQFPLTTTVTSTTPTPTKITREMAIQTRLSLTDIVRENGTYLVGLKHNDHILNANFTCLYLV